MHQYLTRLFATIHSRGDLEIEVLELDQPSATEGHIRGRLRFYDRSVLAFEEKVLLRGRSIVRLEYRYHYQRADGTRVLRYDNAPHHPELPGFPQHVHRPDGVEPADAPDLSDVLREIDGYLYGREGK